MSSESDWVAVTISPWSRRKRITSAAERLSFGPSSRAVEPRSRMTSLSGTGAFEGVYVVAGVGSSSSRFRRRRRGRRWGGLPLPGAPPPRSCRRSAGTAAETAAAAGPSAKASAATRAPGAAPPDRDAACRRTPLRRCTPGAGLRSRSGAATGRRRDRPSRRRTRRAGGRRDRPARRAYGWARRARGFRGHAGAGAWPEQELAPVLPTGAGSVRGAAGRCDGACCGRACCGRMCGGRLCRGGVRCGCGAGAELRAGGAVDAAAMAALQRELRQGTRRRRVLGPAGLRTDVAAISDAGRLVTSRGPPGRTAAGRPGAGAERVSCDSRGVLGRDARRRRHAASRAAGLSAVAFASGSGGATSRRRPSASALRRTRSACASSIEDEWLLTPIPRAMQRSNASLFVSPSSRASS